MPRSRFSPYFYFEFVAESCFDEIVYYYFQSTVWKFMNFSVTQILREINFSKIAFETIFRLSQSILVCTKLPKSKFGASKMFKIAVFRNSESPVVTLFSHQICRKNFLDFHIVCVQMPKSIFKVHQLQEGKKEEKLLEKNDHISFIFSFFFRRRSVFRYSGWFFSHGFFNHQGQPPNGTIRFQTTELWVLHLLYVTIY